MAGTLIERAQRSLRRAAGGTESVSTAAPGAGGIPAAHIDKLFEAARAQVDHIAKRTASPIDATRHKLAQQILEEGRGALVEVTKPAPQLSSSQTIGLEAIVRLVGRPSLLVQDDRVSAPTPEWADQIQAAGAALERAIAKVGRVNIPELGGAGYQGTAFLVRADLVMTNRHVALTFAEAQGGGWRVRSGLKPSVDFKREHQRPAKQEHKVVSVDFVHPDPLVDLALLRVEPQDQAGIGLPQPLELTTSEATLSPDHPVYVVGYPAFDYRNDASAIAQIFGDVFYVKRFAPGNVMQPLYDGVQVGHDCSTLGGNSGSCMIDFGTHRVVGLHFSGLFKEQNQAASIPRLRTDTRLMEFGLNFV